MRDYLFRGKRKDNGEWVEGCGIIATENWVSIFTVIDDIDENSSEVNEIEVLPETVGQFTGLTDKNGKKIFEGDIVTMPAYQGGKKKAVVYFKNGKFAVDGSNYSFKDICPKRMEVIGNIYDNKEILDVK